MKILIACEYSGRVRNAFSVLGHDVISCDFLPSDLPGQHYIGNVFDIINDGFDLMIAHPPCIFLTCSAEWAYKDEQTKNIKPNILIGSARRAARVEAIEFFMKLANANIPKIAIENPVGVISTAWRKPDQFIQPYEFGHDASKKTGLWLKGLPLLQSTEIIKPRLVNGLPRWSNQTDSGQNNLPPSKNRWKLRSLTWQGWADAMASQWG